MAKQYKVIVNNGKAAENKIVEVAGGAGRNGQPVRIKAEQGLKYQLQELQRTQEAAPEYVKVKRIGKDLHVIFEGQRDADLIIEGYYEVMTTPYNGLVGRAETGSFYEYIPEDPNVKGLVPNLREGALPINVALGGAEVSGAGAAIAGVVFGGFGGLGLLGGVVAGVAGTAAVAAAVKQNKETVNGNGVLSDSVAPTVAIASDKTRLSEGQSATITFTLSEPSTDFGTDDVAVRGGTLSNFQGSGTTYTATFTPDANSTVESSVSVASGKFRDAAGKFNADGSEANNTVSMPTDTTGSERTTEFPSIVVTSDKNSLTAGQTAIITFTLSQASTDFTSADVQVSGGTLSNFQGSGKVYTATFTPNAQSKAESVIHVDSYAFQNVAGLENSDGADANNTLTMSTNTVVEDNVSPTIAIASNKTNLSTGQTATITFTLSEASSDFAQSDVTVSGGTLSNFAGSGTTYTATFTPKANSVGDSVVKVDNLRFKDAAGNINVDGAEANNTVTMPTNTTGPGVDTTAPTVAVTSDKAQLLAGQTAVITFTLSEPSTDFTAADVTVAGGTLSNFQGSGASYTATFTPTPNSTADSSVYVGSSKFRDVAGNQNNDGNEADNLLTMPTDTTGLDTIAPTIAITSDMSALSTGQTAQVTFTLSESSTDFTVADVTVAGGTLSNFQGSGVTYTATFTPTPNSTANSVISVASFKFKDDAGNQNTDGADANNLLTIATNTTNADITAPTIAISSDKAALAASQEAIITFTLSEVSTDFSASDVTVSGGTLSNFQGSGTNYTATFSPYPNSTASSVVSVGSLSFRDGAGNLNTDGADSNNRVTMVTNTMAQDTVAPTIAITSDKASLALGQTATITFTLSESSTNFTAADVVVSGGDLSNFQGSGTTYTALFTPNANSAADSSVYVASAAFSDAAGNANIDGAQADNLLTMPTNTMGPDTLVPSIAISSDKVSLSTGQTATITFALSENSSDFTAADVTVSGGTLSNFQGSGAVYTATFTPTPNSTANSVVSVASQKFSDAAGNQNQDGVDDNNTVTMATNTTVPDTTPPTIAITSDMTNLVAGQTATITFTLSEPSTDFTAADVVVTGGILSNFQGRGTNYTAIFTPHGNSTANSVLSVSSVKFSDPAGNPNVDGNDADNTLTMPTNTTLPDTTPPSVVISSNKAQLLAGDTAVITFTLSEASSNFTAADVVVVGGVLSNFEGSGTSYTATFTPDPNSTADSGVYVASGAFTDASGNANTDGAQANNLLIMPTNTTGVDTVAPTIAISSDKASLSTGESATITFTLSEASTDFTAADVAVSGGTLSQFQGSGSSYSASFTPDANSTVNSVVSVASLKFRDAAGNFNTDGAQSNNTLTMPTNTTLPDTSPPSVAISSNKAQLLAGDTAVITFTLSEASSNFSAADVVVVGGVLSNFEGSGTSYTATFTPDPNSTADSGLHVPNQQFSDAAGNLNRDATEANNTVMMVTDTTSNPVTDFTPPSIVISSDQTQLLAGQTATITFTLSEDSTNFSLTDVLVTGGTLNNFQGNGSSYTATFVPTANSTVRSVVSVNSLKFTDAAGNPNIDGKEANNKVTMETNTVVPDNVAPTIAITSEELLLVNGQTATITFTLSEPSDNFGMDDITVVGGALSEFRVSLTDPLVYTAIITPDLGGQQDVAIHVASGVFSDAAGNVNSDSADTDNTLTIPVLQVNNVVTHVYSDGKPATGMWLLPLPSATMTGGAAADALNVTLPTDVIDAGSGPDTITLNDAALKGLNAGQGLGVDGGEDLDTLVLPAAANLLQDALQLLRTGAEAPSSVTTVGTLASYLQNTFTTTQLDAIELQDVMAVLPGGSSAGTFLGVAMTMLGLNGASSLNQALSALKNGSMSSMTLGTLQTALSMYTGQSVNIDTAVNDLIGGAVTYLAADNPQLQTMGGAFTFLQSAVSASILDSKTLGDLMGLAHQLQPDGRLTQLFQTVAQMQGISNSDSLNAVIAKMQSSALLHVNLTDLGTTVADQLALTGTVTDVREGIDLTDPLVAEVVRGIEVFDLTASGAHKLTMNVSNALSLAAGSPHQDKRVFVKGSSQDTVSLSDQYSNGANAGEWIPVAGAPVVVSGVQYVSYKNTAELGVEVLVQVGMQVLLNTAMPPTRWTSESAGQVLVGDLEQGPAEQWSNSVYGHTSADASPRIQGHLDRALEPTWTLDLYRVDPGAGNQPPQLIQAGLALDGQNNWQYQEPADLTPGHQYRYYTVLSDSQSNLNVVSNEYTIEIPASFKTFSFTVADQVLDWSVLTQGKADLQSIEAIDITGTGSNTLKLSLNDVLSQGVLGAFQDATGSAGMVQMKVDGNAGDALELKDLVGSAESGAWVQESSNISMDGHAYKVFTYAALNAQLLIDANIQHTLVSTGNQ